MKQKIIMTVGLPASGKSTWAKEFMSKNSGYKRVNKDDLRSMIDDGKWSGSNEKLIVKARNELVGLFISSGNNVIVDDTNLNPKHIYDMVALFPECDVSIQDFRDVPVDECIKRDLKRGEKSVGKGVILDMYKKYIKPPVEKPPFDEKLLSCIICDIDGTLAKMGNRGPFEWSKVGIDEPNPPVIRILETFFGRNKETPGREPVTIILFSGRDSVCRKETEEWLKKQGVEYHELHMRKEGDMRKDSIVKKELYDAHINGKYNVLFVLDDRNQVVEMWRDLGLTCLQVADGDF